MNVVMLALDKLVTDPNNPRTDITPESLSSLAASIKLHSVKIPLIAYISPAGTMLADGHRRLDAARMAGLHEVPVIVVRDKPGEAEMLSLQLNINGHRAALNPVDEYQAFVRLLDLKGLSPAELAAELSITASETTRVLSLGKLSPQELAPVREGKISKSAAYALSRMQPEQRSAFMSKAASGEITRDELNREARRPRKSEGPKLRRVSFAMAGGGLLTLQCEEALDLRRFKEKCEVVVQACKKFLSQGLDISTAVRVAKDQSRVSPAVRRVVF